MGSTRAIRGIVFAALFAALLSVLSWVNIAAGFSPVPFTLENAVVMLAGTWLGPLYGAASMLLVVVLTLIGMPLLHGSGGLAVLLGNTGGYVWMYPISAFLIGWFMRLWSPRSHVAKSIYSFIIYALFGSFLLYVSGVPWLAHVAHLSMSKAMLYGCYPYLPGDLAKAVVVSLITTSLRVRFAPGALVQGSFVSGE